MPGVFAGGCVLAPHGSGREPSRLAALLKSRSWILQTCGGLPDPPATPGPLCA